MDQGDVTQQLIAVRSGGKPEFDRLFEMVYARLKGMARRQLGSRATPTFDATGLLHEAYVKLVDASSVEWKDRQHFFAVAAKAIRQTAIDHARYRSRQRRGGGDRPETLEDADIATALSPEDTLAVDAALQELAKISPRLVQVVELCFFAGLSAAEAGEVLSVSDRTVKRDWRKAKALLLTLLQGPEDGEAPPPDST